MIEAAVCDDEKNIREQMIHLIKNRQPDCRIDSFPTGAELLSAKKHFDIIFLDIQMEGINGIETARAIREYDKKALLIFITAMKEYVFEAFDVAAFHYLLKPIEEEKFGEVFDRAILEMKDRQVTEESPTLFIKTKNRNFTLKQSDIIYIENRAKKVEIHTVNDVVEAYAVMHKLAGELGNGFYRCHRGYLVNMAHITEYGSDMIEMSNGDKVYLAKGKYPDFVKAYMRYLKNGGTASVSFD